MTPTAQHICTFLVLFFEILFFQPILFHIIAVEGHCMHGILLRSMEELVFWEEQYFDCGLANWSCMSRSVKGGMLVCWYPVICHVCFVVLKLIIPSFTRNWCHYPYNTPICVTVLSFELSVQVRPSLCWPPVCHLTFQNQKIQIFPSLFAEKGTHLGYLQTFLVFLVVNC